MWTFAEAPKHNLFFSSVLLQMHNETVGDTDWPLGSSNIHGHKLPPTWSDTHSPSCFGSHWGNRRSQWRQTEDPRLWCHHLHLFSTTITTDSYCAAAGATRWATNKGRRAAHSPGLSTLITSAPRSPRIMVAKGPARTLQTFQRLLQRNTRNLNITAVLHSYLVTSNTLTPSSGRGFSAKSHKQWLLLHAVDCQLCRE